MTEMVPATISVSPPMTYQFAVALLGAAGSGARELLDLPTGPRQPAV
jgi:hypothetical protein